MKQYFPTFDSGISRKICSLRYLCVFVRWYVRYFGGCIYISCERVGLSSRSRFPAFVFCFIVLYIFVAVFVSLFSSFS